MREPEVLYFMFYVFFSLAGNTSSIFYFVFHLSDLMRFPTVLLLLQAVTKNGSKLVFLPLTARPRLACSLC